MLERMSFTSPPKSHRLDMMGCNGHVKPPARKESRPRAWSKYAGIGLRSSRTQAAARIPAERRREEAKEEKKGRNGVKQ